MKMKHILPLTLILILLSSSLALAGLTKEQELGKLLYFDRFLSLHQNQSCASCHDQGAGFADPLNLRLPVQFPTSAGSDTALFGGRNAPPAGYAMFSPPFVAINADGIPEGGQFWDGRAATLKDQALGPFLNPVEMAMANETAVIAALKAAENPNAADYQILFDKAYKIDLAALNTAPIAVPPGDPSQDAQVMNAYQKLAQAIGEFEKSELFAPFSSKFDAVMAGAAQFTDAEQRGWDMFNRDPVDFVGTDIPAAGCFLCHPAPLFTDFTYDNLGIPFNERVRELTGNADPDLGLGGELGIAEFDGAFKVSSLRNLELTLPFGHNGYFRSILNIVHFYNTAGIKPLCPSNPDGSVYSDAQAIAGNCWPAPEVGEPNRAELGDLGLLPADEDDLVAFLKTLTDRIGSKSYPPAGLPAVP